MPFGRYTLLAPLATGGMGEIYLARFSGPSGFEKLCVIKKILPHLAAEKDFVERFVHEAKILVKLSHGAIAQVLEMGVHEGAPYLALEFVDGKDLRRVMGRLRDRGEQVPLTFALHVMARVLDALAYAHRKRDDDEQNLQLVHRDVSPQNILISYEGEVKVIDFGLAKSSLGSNKTNPTVILGKFLYMSPEQARHQKADRRSDLYAVGLCLYELVAGKHPLDDVPPGELITAVAKPSFPPLSELVPDCPPSLAAVVTRALSLEPEGRFQSAEEFRGKVLGCLLELDPLAGPEAVSHSMREWFEPEYQTERKLLQTARELAGKTPEELASAGRRSTLAELPAIPFDQDLPTPLPLVRDTPAAGLERVREPAVASPLPPPLPTRPSAASFSPTPRMRSVEPAPGMEDTAPRVRLDEATRPGVATLLDELLEPLADKTSPGAQVPLAELEPTQPQAERPKPPMLFARPPVRDAAAISRAETVPVMPRVDPPRPVLRGVPIEEAELPPAAAIPPPPSLPPAPKLRSSPPAPGPRTVSTPSLPTVPTMRVDRPSNGARWVAPLVMLCLLGAVGFVGRDLYRKGMFDSALVALHLKAPVPQAVPEPEPLKLPSHSPLPPGVALGPALPQTAPQAPAPAPAKTDDSDDADLLQPLPVSRPEKVVHRPAHVKRKHAPSELEREWGLTRAAFKRLTRSSPCESGGMGMLCQRYDAVEADLQDADGTDPALLTRIRQLRKSIERKSAQ
jgi:serine/threonine-protein kinase